MEHNNPILLPQSTTTPRRPRHRNEDAGGDSEAAESLSDGAAEEEEEGEEDQSGSGGGASMPEVGMVFRTHQEAARFYKRYARRLGFGVSVRRSSFSKDGQCLYLELMCCKGGRKRPEPKFRKRPTSTTDCPARLRFKLWGDSLLHLELASLDHNHPLIPSLARFLDPRRPSPSPPPDPFHGLHDLLFSSSSSSSSSSPRPCLPLRDADADALRLFLTRMQAKSPAFFHALDLDPSGCLRSVFWADARSRAAYPFFSDAVYLDTACLAAGFDLPLALLVAANHHAQPVLLGCALLADDSADTFAWLLKAWLASAAGRAPRALVTDHCKGAQTAIAEVLPGVRHRLCLHQIMRKVGGPAEYRAVTKQLQKAVYDSLRIEEFEEEWGRMVEAYGLQGNEWLRSLYECRLSWVPAYLKDTFWAGISTTQRNESVSGFFDGYVDAKTSLRQFVGKYEMALQSKYEREAQADFETFHKRRPAVSKFIMEEQLSKVYTLNVFKKFQDEIEAIMYCHASLVRMEGSISTFDVKECIFLDDGKKTMNKNYEVLFNTQDKEVQCICGSFPFRGILCRHALSVFKFQQVHEIPSQFILDRWKKDYKRLHVMARSSSDVVANNRVDRYDYLSKRCLQLAEVGMLSDKYQLALKLIKEAEKFLLNEGTYEDTQPKIVSRVPKTNKLNRTTVSSEKNSNKNEEQQSTQPQQGKLSQEGVDTTPLPFPGHFRPPMNQQQYIGNPVGSRPGIVYMFPGGVDPQAFGHGPILPWMYPEMFQTGQQPMAPPDPRARQVPKRRKVRHKPGQAVRNSDAPHGPPASSSTGPFAGQPSG